MIAQPSVNEAEVGKSTRPPLNRYRRRRDLLAAFGYAATLLSSNVAIWTSPTNDYYLRGENGDGLLSCLVALGLIATMVYGMLRMARRATWMRIGLVWLAFPAAVFALNRLRIAVGFPVPPGLPSRIVLGALLLGALLLIAKSPLRAGRALHAGFRWCFALSLVLVATLVEAWARPPAVAPNVDGGPPTAKPLILWAVFDELDEGWLFSRRPADLALPAFDQLARESLVCTQAQRPGPETLFSLPALTTGRPVRQTVVVSRHDLRIDYEDGRQGLWSKADTVFDDMLQMGRVPAINGYYHNYPGVFGTKVRQAQTWTIALTGFWATLEWQFLLTLPDKTRRDVLDLLGRASVSNREGAVQHRQRLDEQNAALERTLRARSADFVFLHCRVPHAPWMLDYRTQRSGFVPSPDGYFGNLMLADATLGHLMNVLRETGQWDRATLLVTADHNLRTPLRGVMAEHLVPLMLKLPGQKEARRLDQPVHAVDERWLIDAIARGEVHTPAQAADFLVEAAAHPARARTIGSP